MLDTSETSINYEGIQVRSHHCLSVCLPVYLPACLPAASCLPLQSHSHLKNLFLLLFPYIASLASGSNGVHHPLNPLLDQP